MDYEEKALSILLIGIVLVIGLVLLAINSSKSRAKDRNQGIVVQDQKVEKTPSKTKTYEYTIISE